MRYTLPLAALISLTLVTSIFHPVTSQATQAEEPKLELKQSAHIAIIGNTLADRMQHDGWLETYLHSRFPKLDLVVRNLGFSADEITIRPRSARFGTPEEWLAQVKADVVFAFFGYNESFAGAEGLEAFKKNLTDFVKKTTAANYSGKGNAQLVLFSPIAHEDLKDPNLPDGKANNDRLKLYTQAMEQVAKENKVRFVNLFDPTAKLFQDAGVPLTINGIHLNSQGNQLLAKQIDQSLFGKGPIRQTESMEKLRQAVVDKNFHWYQRYRTTDGYSIYGERAFLKFTDGQTNKEVAQREMEVLDVMTANRDKRIWSLANGEDMKIIDNNLPPFIPVKTNKPGAGPGGKHLFLSGEEAISKMTVGKGLKVSLFASEEKFPELAKPVQMSFDAKGRLWVAVWPSYPHWKPTEEMNDKLLILEDTDGDGKADKVTTFADKLHNPTGFEFWNGGVLIAQAPDLVFLKDTDGDGKADLRQKVIHGLDSADTHHTSNSFTFDPGGGLYFQEGTFHHTSVETPYGPAERCINAGVFRYHPVTQKFDVYVSYPFANPHGHIFDRWGQDIVIDGTGSQPYHAALFSGKVVFPDKHSRTPQVYQQRTRPCPGLEVLSSSHFPKEWQGHMLVGNVIGFQGILRYKISDSGASFSGSEQEPMLSSSDPNFRPSDLKIGPDGALYFIDWHNPIIGHMQHNLRDPNRDREHGRVYKVTYEGSPLSKPVNIAGEPTAKLLDLLKSDEDRVRYRVRLELSSRPANEVIAEVKRWVAALDKNDAEFEHHRLEALWQHQWHNIVNVELLQQVLASPDFRARSAAARVLCYWKDAVPSSLEIFKKLTKDPHPRVRLEAVRAASFYLSAEAMEIPILSSEMPSDQYIEFVRGETMRTLQPFWRKAVAAGKAPKFSSDAGMRFLLGKLSIDELQKLPKSKSVSLELLQRKGVLEEVRREALRSLAELEGKSTVKKLAEVLRENDAVAETDDTVLFDLHRLLASNSPTDLEHIRAELTNLSTQGLKPVTRQIAYANLVAVEKTPLSTYTQARIDLGKTRDFMAAVPMIKDPSHRAELFPKAVELLTSLPKEFRIEGTAGVTGRFVRIEIPVKRRPLTLAEVEVYSRGQNIARKGKAKQSSTSHNGTASRAIDGNKSGVYAEGGQTHTPEDGDNPWWELDLGQAYPIDSITIYNRTEGNFFQRLNGFTLQVLDASRRAVFEKKGIAAPQVKGDYAIGGESPAQQLRTACMLALTTVRGQEAVAIKTLLPLLKEEKDRDAVIRTLLRVPVAGWSPEQAPPVVSELLSYLKKIPTDQRSAPFAVDALNLAESLSTLLPAAEAKATRKNLRELGVRVIRLGTLTEQMLFDQERLVVEAGKPIELYLENTDFMPHNLVLIQPGTLTSIGEETDRLATDPQSAQRQYVPPSKNVLLSTKLLQPGEAEKLSFKAPTQPGVYPYVCTYPGHWRRMHGALYVVADLDAYQENSEGYLKANNITPRDEQLKNNRPRKEWKLEELANDVNNMKAGRSFTQGKHLFAAASCISCHKMEDKGQNFGPDLNTQLDPKWKTSDILDHILDPSKKIDDKYKTYSIELKSGKVATGMLLKETADLVQLIENPLVSTKTIDIPVNQIAERKASNISLMPKGLLDKFTAEEIQDLLAYIVAKGSSNHPLFRAADPHGHK